MTIARQNTARTVMIGPVLDADGVAVTDGVVADFKGSVNGGAPAALNGSATLTHRNTGFYSLALTATDLATVGSFEVVIDDTVNCCPMKVITVVEEAVYDALFAAGALGYVANAPVVLADGVSHGGTLGSSTATLALSRIRINSQTSNTNGIQIAGNGTGAGIAISSGAGATGTGVSVSAASTNGSAITLAGQGSGDGLTSTGGSTGHGISGVGGSASGNGIRAAGTAGNSVGLNIIGQGSAAGLLATGGDTGHGMSLVGGVTSGDGLRTVATTSGTGITASGVGTSKAGIIATGGSTSSNGITATGGGTGHGIAATSGTGATGNGMTLLSQSTNGHGLKSTGTGTGDGAELTAGASGADLNANIAGVLTTVTTATTTTNLTNLPTIPTNWLTADGLAADAVSEIQSGLATASALATVGSTVDAILVDTAEIGPAGAGLTALATQASVNAIDDFLDTEIAAILADTNELQTDWVDGGRLDLILDSRAGQTSVDDLPTNAELATALAGSDDATLAAIAALNNLSAAQVNAEVDAALVDIHLDHLLAVTYDPASKPGAADALLNELVESDAGVARYTANALEQAPTGGSAPTASQIADEVQTRTIAAVTLVTTTTNLTNLPTMPTDWLTAAGISAGAVSEIQSGLATPTNITAGTLTTVTNVTTVNGLAANVITASSIAADAITAAKIADGAIDAATFAADVDAEILSYIVDDATRIDASLLNTATLTAIPATYAATVTNIPATLATIASYIDTEVGAIKAKTDNLPSDPADQSLIIAATDAITSSIAALNNVSTAQVQTAAAAALTAYDPPTNAEMEARTLLAASYFDPTTDAVFLDDLVEAYPADGSTSMTLDQAIYSLLQNLTEFAISGTTLTVKKRDGSTTAETYTLDSATSPTSRTRSS